MPDPRISSVVSRAADAATVAWAHAGTGDLASLPDPELAIAAAAALGNVSALQAVTAPKTLRKAAAAALHRLKSQGVKVVDAAPARAFTLAAEVVEVPPRAWLGVPDENGGITLVLTATDNEGSCIAEVRLGEPDAHMEHGHASRGELRDLWRRLGADAGLKEVPFVLGLHLADGAVGARADHGWKHFMEKVADSQLAAARGADPASFAGAPVDEAIAETRVACLPLSLINAGLSAERLRTSASGDDAWIDDCANDAVNDQTRAGFVAAARMGEVALRVHGRMGAADDAAALANKLEQGVAGSELFAVRSAVMRATMYEVYRRAEQESGGDEEE